MVVGGLLHQGEEAKFGGRGREMGGQRKGLL